MARWITDGVCPMDIAGYTIERGLPFQNSRRFRSERIVEQLGVLFGDGGYPTFHNHTARGIRRSPLHDIWVAHRAHFADSAGWEFVEWFYPEGEPEREIPWTWGRGFWGPWVAEEHRTVREAVGAMDMTLMSKFLVQGPDAAAILDRLSANAVAGPVGQVTYTQWCNDAGGILADLTVTRLAEDRFYNTYPCVIMTGKGQPDVATRLFLNKVRAGGGGEQKVPEIACEDRNRFIMCSRAQITE